MPNQITQLRYEVSNFIKERDWEQFHNPKNLVQALTVEAAELSELFLWVSEEESYNIAEEKFEEVSDEMADIFAYLLSLSNVTGIDLEEALKIKMEKNKKKYPVDKVKGSSKKYTEYEQ